MKASATLRSLSFAALASTALLFATTSCNKDNTAPADNLESAEDNGSAEEENAAISDIINASAPADASVAGSAPAADAADYEKVLSRCAIRTYDATTRTLTIDFGTTNCVCANGKTRRGKIIVRFSPGPYRQPGAITTVTLDNYFVNDNQHTGTRVFTNTGSGSFTLDVQNASIITPAGTHSWNSQRQYVCTAGFGTPTILDNTYQVTGQATGTNRKNVSYTATIQQPLLKSFAVGCARHFVSGTVSITNSKEKTLLLNYDPTGSAACDNIATITVNGRTKTIRLK
ncbi:hypothetical protein SAMN02745146_2926 [Hymenobacter daecheongensis DSM 21074]|uniref:Lipoprotein n=1 Tax=Hymenobacter daecheongensis DSM 21074 TaxID=1121955 RepID=A0A1M6IPR8_9BACT|nr:hypothetical protein [Hymenobacter daecheongensis]SHJ36446.1 hypothetical protein SAMN02745146_2926 [Hymenobacter daecheongensis DSM 21074]